MRQERPTTSGLLMFGNVYDFYFRVYNKLVQDIKVPFQASNGTLLKMFSMIDIGERAGSGIPNILSVWKKQGWSEPSFTESMEPDRISLSLAITKTSDKKSALKTSVKRTSVSKKKKQQILEYLTDQIEAKTIDIAAAISLQPAHTRVYLAELVQEGAVVAVGSNRNRRYRLKS